MSGSEIQITQLLVKPSVIYNYVVVCQTYLAILLTLSETRSCLQFQSQSSGDVRRGKPQGA